MAFFQGFEITAFPWSIHNNLIFNLTNNKVFLSIKKQALLIKKPRLAVFICKNCRNLRKLEPTVGLEPTTCCLQDSCSTS